MQIANILLSLGGDHGNTIPKFAVTAAEIAVLRAIHGEDAVKDIEPLGVIQRSNREERARLVFTYGAAKTHDQKPIVEGMFPGVAARVFETLDELELDESFFKPTGRLKANSVSLRANGPTIAEFVAAGYSARKYPPRGYASKSTPEEIAAAIAAETPAEPDAPSWDAEVAGTDDGAEDDDGIGEINDGHAESNILG